MIEDCTLYHEYSKDMLEMAISVAISKNSLEDVKYIFTSPLVEHKEEIDIHFSSDVFLEDACTSGNLEILRYLLTSPDLKEHSNIFANDCYAFHLACKNGHLDVVQYLISSPDLKEHVNIFSGNNYALQLACQHNQTDIVRYLLTSPDLKEHPNVTDKSHDSFKLASIHNSLDVLKYLIFDYNMDVTDHITMVRKNYRNSAVEEMFSLRQLHDDLNQDLNEVVSKDKTNRIKV